MVVGCGGVGKDLVYVGHFRVDEVFFVGGGAGGIAHVVHPTVPLGGDGGGVVVVDVGGLDPAVLAEGVVDSVLKVLVAASVGADEATEFERVVTVDVHVLEEALPAWGGGEGLGDVNVHQPQKQFESHLRAASRPV